MPATGSLGFGTAPLGGLFEAVSATHAQDAILAAHERGIRYYDTAPLYGYGLAEERLGHAFGASRSDVMVGTKVGRLLRRGRAGHRDQFVGAPPLEAYLDWTADGIRRSLEESLARLQVDHIDIVFLHDPTPSDFEEVETQAFPALSALQEQGVVNAVGAGMNDVSAAAELLRRLDLDVVLIAGRLSLLDQTAAHELLPLCDELGVDVIVGGVFNSGVLADPSTKNHYNYKPAPAHVVARAQEIALVCEASNSSLAAAALQFPLRYPGVISVIPGMRSRHEVRTNLELMSTAVPERAWSELEDRGLIPRR